MEATANLPGQERLITVKTMRIKLRHANSTSRPEACQSFRGYSSWPQRKRNPATLKVVSQPKHWNQKQLSTLIAYVICVCRVSLPNDMCGFRAKHFVKAGSNVVGGGERIRLGYFV